eukprot:4822004-Amphidinium_carterae.1
MSPKALTSMPLGRTHRGTGDDEEYRCTATSHPAGSTGARQPVTRSNTRPDAGRRNGGRQGVPEHGD